MESSVTVIVKENKGLTRLQLRKQVRWHLWRSKSTSAAKTAARESSLVLSYSQGVKPWLWNHLNKGKGKDRLSSQSVNCVLIFWFLTYVYVDGGGCECFWVQYPQNQRVRSPGTGFTGSRETPGIGAGKRTLVFSKNSPVPCHWACSPAPSSLLSTNVNPKHLRRKTTSPNHHGQINESKLFYSRPEAASS